jgi:hypothetical protein
MQPIEVLSDEEQQALANYEQTIEQGLATFMQVGLALQAIRDGRLYRAEYATWEEYLQKRWPRLSRYRAHQQIAAALAARDVQDTIGAVVQVEAHANALRKYDPAWRGAVYDVAQRYAQRADVQLTTSIIHAAGDALQTVMQGVLPDADGEMQPLQVLMQAHITDEVYERMQRQIMHIRAHSSTLQDALHEQGVYIEVQGEPVSWKVSTRGSRRLHRMRAWQQQIKLVCNQVLAQSGKQPFVDPVGAHCMIYVHTASRRADLTNLWKCIEDALQVDEHTAAGGVIYNDAQVQAVRLSLHRDNWSGIKLWVMPLALWERLNRP